MVIIFVFYYQKQFSEWVRWRRHKSFIWTANHQPDEAGEGWSVFVFSDQVLIDTALWICYNPHWWFKKMFKSEQLEVWTLSYSLWDYTDLIIWRLGHDYKCMHFKKTKEKHNRSLLKIAWMCYQEFLSWASESTQQEGFSSFQRAKCNWMPVAIDQTFIVSDQFRASLVRRAPSVYTPFIFQADIRLLTNKKQQLTAASVF